MFFRCAPSPLRVDWRSSPLALKTPALKLTLTPPSTGRIGPSHGIPRAPQQQETVRQDGGTRAPRGMTAVQGKKG